MASCGPDKSGLCLESSRMEAIALTRLETARRNKLNYSFWITQASSILNIHYGKQGVLSKTKSFQELLKLAANCFHEDLEDLLRDATDDEACRLIYYFNLVAQLVEEASDDERLKEMFVSITDDEEAEYSQIDGDDADILAKVKEADGKACIFSSEALTSGLNSSGEVMRVSDEDRPEAKTVVASSAASMRSDQAACLKSSCEISEIPPELEHWCKFATREDLIKRVLDLSVK